MSTLTLFLYGEELVSLALGSEVLAGLPFSSATDTCIDTGLRGPPPVLPLGSFSVSQMYAHSTVWPVFQWSDSTA